MIFDISGATTPVTDFGIEFSETPPTDTTKLWIKNQSGPVSIKSRFDNEEPLKEGNFCIRTSKRAALYINGDVYYETAVLGVYKGDSNNHPIQVDAYGYNGETWVDVKEGSVTFPI